MKVFLVHGLSHQITFLTFNMPIKTNRLICGVSKREKDLIKIYASQEGKKVKDFLKDAVFGYCRIMGYTEIYDDVNVSLANTNEQI